MKMVSIVSQAHRACAGHSPGYESPETAEPPRKNYGALQRTESLTLQDAARGRCKSRHATSGKLLLSAAAGGLAAAFPRHGRCRGPEVARLAAAAGDGGRSGGRAAREGPDPHCCRLQAPIRAVRDRLLTTHKDLIYQGLVGQLEATLEVDIIRKPL